MKTGNGESHKQSLRIRRGAQRWVGFQRARFSVFLPLSDLNIQGLREGQMGHSKTNPSNIQGEPGSGLDEEGPLLCGGGVAPALLRSRAPQQAFPSCACVRGGGEEQLRD